MTIEKALECYEKAKREGKLTRKRQVSKYIPYNEGIILLPVPDAVPVLGEVWYYVRSDGRISEVPVAVFASKVDFDDAKTI